jgi:hypothetical protein
MTRRLLVLGLITGLGLFLQVSFQDRFHRQPFENQKAQAAETIPSVFRKNWDQLSPEKRGHFLVRLYRLSGEAQHVPEIRIYADRLAARFSKHAQNLNNPEYIQKTAAHFLKLPEKPLLKHRYRARIRSQWPEMAFSHRLFFLAFQIKSFGLHQGALQADFDRVLQYLTALPARDYVFQDEVIRYNATRAVNLIYQLKFLGIADYEADFIEKFKTFFFSQPDPLLDRTLYLNKIYGLTHLIIADSNFYQHAVDAEKWAWVLDYFAENIETLLVRNTPDAAAEIAVCFKLAGKAGHPTVSRIQEFLLRRYDAKRGYIPSDRKEFTIDAIEHRNVLAWMALSDWKGLYAGPDLKMTPHPTHSP